MPPSGLDAAVAAILAGQPVAIPTDTVYGLVSTAATADGARRIAALKSRDIAQPMALMAASPEDLLAALPELPPAARAMVAELLPGPYTLVLANPAGRYAWLNGATPGAVGVRVPDLPPAARAVLARTGAVASTSANLHGAPAPRSFAELAPEILAGCAAALDAGHELPGTPSTVLDLAGPQPRVIREGAAPSGPAIARALAAAARAGA